MLESTIRIHSDNYIFSHCLTSGWSPSKLGGGHWLLHLRVQGVRLLSSVYIINAHRAIVASLGNVLVMWVKTDAESLVLE